MTRHKSRVARRSRRRARRGTRKQSGGLFGFSLNPFTWGKNPEPTAEPAAAVDATAQPSQPAKKSSWFSSFFGDNSKPAVAQNTNPPATAAAPVGAVAVANPAAVQSPASSMVGGRKTRHRRRSPRRHRK